MPYLSSAIILSKFKDDFLFYGKGRNKFINGNSILYYLKEIYQENMKAKIFLKCYKMHFEIVFIF